MGGLGLRQDFDTRLLAAQNRERAALGVPPLKWNPALAVGAQSWAKHLARTGRFEHSPDDPAAEPEGENLWAGSVGQYPPESMIGLWIAEKRDFKPGVFPNNSRSGRVESVSHYTQLVWADTHEVGCALERGTSEDILVCRYAQAGNVIGGRVS
ncbi:MAG: CAP domain-containing protein [Sphingomicrobium sp.]